MLSSSTFPHLYTPLTVGTCTLRNRIALPATLTNYGAGNRITERWITFLAERARGGAALIVSEIIAVDPNAIANPAIVTGFDDANLPGFERAANEVTAAGAHLVAQLWHPGRQQLWHPTRSPMGVSDQPDAYSWTVPHVMSEQDIEALVAAFVSVAQRLRGCGLSGVELHGAHGYLLGQFLSPWSNTRNDRYGGTLENRLRCCLEIATGIREACGPDFIIGLKMPAREGVPGGIDPQEAARITELIAAARAVDYFAYGQGNFSRSLEDHVPDMHYRPGHFIALHKQMRAVAGGIPVMALGRIGTPTLAEQVVAEGYADLVGLCRAQVSDAAFADKAREGRIDAIRPCIFDNGCWGEVHAGKPLAEFQNPHLAEPGEATWAPRPSGACRRVAVVGAGLAGLEAAWVAAARGHHVTLFSASRELGGKARLEARLPGHGEVAKVYAHQRRQAERYGVNLVPDKCATADDVLASDPDIVVLATGSQMRCPDVLNAAVPQLMSAHEYAAERCFERGHRARTAVLYDHDHSAPTYAIAQALTTHHQRVVLLTPRTHIAQAVNYCSALGIYRRLYTAQVEIIVAAEPTRIVGDELAYANVFSAREHTVPDVDLVVYSTPRRSNDSLARAFAQTPVRLIGDCMAPRNRLIAIHEGHLLANAL